MTKKDIGIAIWTVVLWSLNIVFQKIAVGCLSIFVLSFLRVALVFPLLWLYPKPKKSLWKYAICGFFLYGLYLILFGFGLQSDISAGLSAFVCQLQVICTIVCCFFLLGERPTWYQNIGILVSSVGVYFLKASTSSVDFPLFGVALLIGSCLSYGIGIALSKKYKIGGSLEDVTWCAMAAAGPLLLACFVFDGPLETIDNITNMSSTALFCVLFAVVASTIWATYLWLSLLQRNSASSVVPFFLLTAVFSNIFSNMILGESLTSLQMVSGSIIIMGLVFTQGVHQHIPSVVYWVKQKVTL